MNEDENKNEFSFLDNYKLQGDQRIEAETILGRLKSLGINLNPLGHDGKMTTKDKFDTGINAVQTGLNAYLGLKQLGLAKRNYSLQREAFNANMANQKNTLNRELEQQYMRSSFKDRLAPSKDAYMQRWGY